MMCNRLISLLAIPTELVQSVGYPGEARYLGLVKGMANEVWYDDGQYTGLSQVSAPLFLEQAALTDVVLMLFATGQCPPDSWFLLDQYTGHLLIGPCEMVTQFLQTHQEQPPRPRPFLSLTA